MKPLNEDAVKKATTRFIAMYAISLVAVLLFSFFLFSSPVKIYRKQATNYNAFKTQYDAVKDRTARATSQINDLVEVQKVISMNPSPGLDSMVKQYNDGLKKEINSLKDDSASNALPLMQEDVKNYLAAYNAILFYTENHHNNTEAKPPVLDNDNSKDRFIGKLQTENLDLKNAVNSLKEELRLLRSVSPQTGNTGGADVSLLRSKLSAAEKDRDRYKLSASQLQETIRSKDGQINTLEGQVTALNNRLKNASSTNNQQLTEEEKATVLYQSVAQVIRRARAENKGVYKGLKDILTSIQNTYPDKNQLNQRIRELNAIISQDF